MTPMADHAAPQAPPPKRKPRADAARNRELLLDTAKQVFAAKGPAASLDEIAKAAGVGIGTLYRHFPTREALVEQVYRNETTQLAQAADRLSAALPPVEALRQWLLLFIDYFATKQIMAAALSAMPGGTAALYASSAALLSTSITTLTDRAVQSGDISLSVAPLDLLRAISGVASLSAGPGWETSARQLVNVLLAGMRTPNASQAADHRGR
jgi:AcrR family transcriptional regulator